MNNAQRKAILVFSILLAPLLFVAGVNDRSLLLAFAGPLLSVGVGVFAWLGRSKSGSVDTQPSPLARGEEVKRLRQVLVRLGVVTGTSVGIVTCMGFGSDLEPKFGVIEYLAGFAGNPLLLGALCGGAVTFLFLGASWILQGTIAGERIEHPSRAESESHKNEDDSGAD